MEDSVRQRFLSFISPVIFLVIWEVLSRTNVLDMRFFPPPSAILVTMYHMIISGELWADLSVSLYRILGGFVLGTIPGLIIGLSMGLFKPVRLLLEPLVAATYPIPKLALMPLFMLILGLGDMQKIVTIATGTFFLVLINTVAGVINLDKIYLDVARNFGASRKDYYLTVALPGALPLIFTGLNLGMGMALLLIVAAEMNGANQGIGYLIWESYDIFDLNKMFVAFIMISLLGYIFNVILNEIERWIVPWKQ
ncbi:taurine ABC transporter permease [Desulfotomaculum copahuensis]|uniref:Taurine ABC transporter permease n=2 Tax=Desulfotomaculum copahuensis TaxID=1838280 RepID=A0A1B7LIA4_9FIRM|nr:taurine ABC transporter permease [Desulfotomaculum copahuensis]